MKIYLKYIPKRDIVYMPCELHGTINYSAESGSLTPTSRPGRKENDRRRNAFGNVRTVGKKNW